jgi:hypothetical protein
VIAAVGREFRPKFESAGQRRMTGGVLRLAAKQGIAGVLEESEKKIE